MKKFPIVSEHDWMTLLMVEAETREEALEKVAAETIAQHAETGDTLTASKITGTGTPNAQLTLTRIGINDKPEWAYRLTAPDAD